MKLIFHGGCVPIAAGWAHLRRRAGISSDGLYENTSSKVESVQSTLEAQVCYTSFEILDDRREKVDQSDLVGPGNLW